ncbi:unnamed protein product [Pocillopora meandrina]|uniref:Uncharacterized protein n=1 Tax=Pocillopora meandrina TaxID=46732 RepID=A0AAU9WTS4_9CNID|nr:unnamed protein product [Pocillopora meandrina]
MAFQIANLRHSNSKTNTVVFAMFHAKDSWANLKNNIILIKIFIFVLPISRGKKKVVFLFGDYEFLCKLFGINTKLNGCLFQVCVPGLHISLGVFKKLFDKLENQCFELDKKIQMVLAGDSEENDEKIQAFRAAQLHTRQAQQFNEKANYLQKLLN